MSNTPPRPAAGPGFKPRPSPNAPAQRPAHGPQARRPKPAPERRPDRQAAARRRSRAGASRRCRAARRARPAQGDQRRADARSDAHARPAASRASREDIDLAKAYAIRAQKEKDERIEAERPKQEEARLRREAQGQAGRAAQGQGAQRCRPPRSRATSSTAARSSASTSPPTQLKALNAGELGVVQKDGRYVLVDAAVLAQAEAIFAAGDRAEGRSERAGRGRSLRRSAIPGARRPGLVRHCDGRARRAVSQRRGHSRTVRELSIGVTRHRDLDPAQSPAPAHAACRCVRELRHSCARRHLRAGRRLGRFQARRASRARRSHLATQCARCTAAGSSRMRAGTRSQHDIAALLIRCGNRAAEARRSPIRRVAHARVRPRSLAARGLVVADHASAARVGRARGNRHGRHRASRATRGRRRARPTTCGRCGRRR